MEFCKAFNEKTKAFMGKPVPVVITVYKDKKFDFIIKSPPASHFIREAAKLKSGSKEPGRVVAGSITMKQAEAIAKEKKFFPGYVLIKLELTKEIYHMIKNLQKVSGFLGSGEKPTPISDNEIKRILGQVSDNAVIQKAGVSFEIGEKVKVCDGPFASFNGLIEEIDEEKSRLKVSVSIFGRATPVDLEFNQVEKN